MKYKITLFLFICVIIGVGLLNILLPSKEVVSALENRTLTPFPQITVESFFSGDFFQGVENYYNDHVYERESFVFLSQKISSLKGFKGHDSVELIASTQSADVASGNTNEDTAEITSKENQTDLVEEQAQISTSTQKTEKPVATVDDLNQLVRTFARNDLDFFSKLETEPIPYSNQEKDIEELSITEEKNLSGGILNDILVVNDSCYEIFGSKESACKYYANAINGFSEQLEETDKVYSMIVPSHIEFIPSEKYRSMADSQADAIKSINAQLSEKVRPINTYTVLGEHLDEYIFFRSDHHWTALGAYYGYTSFIEATGDIPYNLDDFERVDYPDFLGSLYNRSFSKAVKANPDYISVYKPFIESDFIIYTVNNSIIKDRDVINIGYSKIANKYMMFISGDNPLSVINTKLDNGKKILVFKDSFGNALIPYLISHYDEIHIIDPRHYKKGALTYARENDIHEFLFINSAIVIAGGKGFAENMYRVSY